MRVQRSHIVEETRKLRAFQRDADEITHLIVNTDLPWVDVAIRVQRLRDLCEQAFPGKGFLLEMVYAGRFRRLWRQWRRTPPDDDF